jgi:hypothetical protein
MVSIERTILIYQRGNQSPKSMESKTKYNGHRKKEKRTNSGMHNTTQKTKL